MEGGGADSFPQAESLFLSWENQAGAARAGGPCLSWAADASKGGPGFQELGVRGDPWEGGRPLCPGSLTSPSQPCSGSGSERPLSQEMRGLGMERKPGPLHLSVAFPSDLGVGSQEKEKEPRK